jgi:hypothetical protein
MFDSVQRRSELNFDPGKMTRSQEILGTLFI